MDCAQTERGRGREREGQPAGMSAVRALTTTAPLPAVGQLPGVWWRWVQVMVAQDAMLDKDEVKAALKLFNRIDKVQYSS